MNWSVEYLNEIVRQEVCALPSDMRAGLSRIAELIETFGLNRIKMPYVRHLRGKLWEMRAQGRDGIARSIYVAATGRRVIILRAFAKKTTTTPQSEIELALQGKGD